MKVLGFKIEVPKALVHRYVTATLYVHTQRLAIQAQDHPWREELSFPLNL